ncbi:MAG: PAS domain S-box protein [Chitinophagales bacterium]
MTKTHLNILVIDDDRDDRFITITYLQEVESYTVTIEEAATYDEAWRKVRENRHDIYVIDYLLGARTGVELIRESITAGTNKPYILLTGKGDKRIDVEAAKAGAYDYLIKNELDAETLERSFRYCLQRYHSYQALSESETRYREIFNKSNEIIFIIDDQQQFIDCNPAIETVMGYKTNELKQMRFTDFFVSAEERDNFRKKLMENGSVSDFEVVFQTRNGEQRNFLISCGGIVTPKGQQWFQGLLHDYTIIKKSEAEKMIREKSEAVRMLVRTLAHEIRNPLTNINLSIDQLHAEMVDGRKDLAESVKENSKRINDLISELMQVANRE